MTTRSRAIQGIAFSVPENVTKLAVDSNYLYVGGTSHTYQLNKTTMQVIGTLNIAPKDLNVYNGYLYVTTNSTLYKVNPSTFLSEQTLALPYGGDLRAIFDCEVAGDALYISRDAVSGEFPLTKINLLTFTVVGSLIFGASHGRGLAKNADGSKLLLLINTPNLIDRINLSLPWNGGAIEAGQALQHNSYRVVVSGNTAYVTTNSKTVDAYDVSTLSYLGSADSLAGDELSNAWPVISNSLLYVGSALGYLNKFNITPSFSFANALKIITEYQTSLTVGPVVSDGTYIYAGAISHPKVYRIHV